MREDRNKKSYDNFSSRKNSERNSENFSRNSRDSHHKNRHHHSGNFGAKGFAFLLGQIFGLVYNLAVLGVVYRLIGHGEKSLALKIFAINAAVIAFGFVITKLERIFFPRKFHNNRRHNRKFRDQRRPAESNFNR